MNFLLTLYTNPNSYRNFTLQGVSLETGLEFVNTIVNQGDQLQSIRCIDGNACIDLPVHIFDGESVTQSLLALQQEWEQLLSQPLMVPEPAKTDWIDWSKRVDQIKQNRVAHLKGCHWQIQLLAERAELMREGPHKRRLLNHYQRLLEKFSCTLAQTAA